MLPAAKDPKDVPILCPVSCGRPINPRKTALSSVFGQEHGFIKCSVDTGKIDGFPYVGSRQSGLDLLYGKGELGLIGFVLSNVRCSLFVVLWDKPFFLLYLCLYYPF
jgi:hypothetical protein